MKKFFLLGTILVASTAFAFGGIGIGKLQRHKSKGGVDAIGVHIDANGSNETPNIILANCDAYAGTGLVDNETYNGGYAGLASDNQTQCRCPTGTKWNDGACIASEGATCTSWTTNECGTGYYCQFNSTDSCDAGIGICSDISSCEMYDMNIGSIQFRVAGGYCSPNWWTAQSVCQAEDRTLVSLADIGCSGYEGDECPSEILENIGNAGLSEFWSVDKESDCGAWYIYNSDISDDGLAVDAVSGILCIKQ